MIRRAQQFKDQLLSFSIGIIYLWFGTLKFIPGASPAESLVKDTLHLLTFGLVPDNTSFLVLASWEVLIGLMLLFRINLKLAIGLAFLHLTFTFSPLLLLPSISFRENILYLSLVGQYIIKNIIIISALLYLYPEVTLAPRQHAKA